MSRLPNSVTGQAWRRGYFGQDGPPKQQKARENLNVRAIVFKTLEDAMPDWRMYDDRPARKQVNKPLGPSGFGGGGGEYNIWYDKDCGGRENRYEIKKLEKAITRCMIKLDAGRTRADDADCHTCCIYFAKGCCAVGSKCQYLHRVPTPVDDGRLGLVQDIFGRDRHRTERDDMGGVGSFERPGKTLFVSLGGATEYGAQALKSMLVENFGEWGPLDNVYVVVTKGIAFVKYHMRASAEFAKEAMHCQSLKGSTKGEILDVKWANEDPNPESMRRQRREALMGMVKAVEKATEEAPEHRRLYMTHQAVMAKAPSAYPNTDAQYPDGGGGEGEGGYPDTDAQFGGYPNTDAQYAAGGATGGGGGNPYAQYGYPSAEAYHAAWQAYYAQQGQQGAGGHVHAPGCGHAAGGAEGEGEPQPAPGMYPGAAPGVVLAAAAQAGGEAGRRAAEAAVASGHVYVEEGTHVYDVEDFPVFAPEEIAADDAGKEEEGGGEPGAKRQKTGTGGEEGGGGAAGALALVAGYASDDSD